MSWSGCEPRSQALHQSRAVRLKVPPALVRVKYKTTRYCGATADTPQIGHWRIWGLENAGVSLWKVCNSRVNGGYWPQRASPPAILRKPTPVQKWSTGFEGSPGWGWAQGADGGERAYMVEKLYGRIRMTQ